VATYNVISRRGRKDVVPEDVSRIAGSEVALANHRADMTERRAEHEDRVNDDGGKRVVAVEHRGGHTDDGEADSAQAHLPLEGVVGQPIRAATGAGRTRCGSPRINPPMPTNHNTPASSEACFQSSTPMANLIAKSIRNPASGTYEVSAETRGSAPFVLPGVACPLMECRYKAGAKRCRSCAAVIG
jgi:hypothetical protein